MGVIAAATIIASAVVAATKVEAVTGQMATKTATLAAISVVAEATRAVAEEQAPITWPVSCYNQRYRFSFFDVSTTQAQSSSFCA